MITETFSGGVAIDGLAMMVYIDMDINRFVSKDWGFSVEEYPVGYGIYINYHKFGRRFFHAVTDDGSTYFSIYDMRSQASTVYDEDELDLLITALQTLL